MQLTIIIPVYNDASRLGRCLSSLQPLTDTAMAEVVVVDDGSDIVQQRSIASIVDSFGPSFHLLRRPHQGAAAARNAGIDAARGDYLWFVDADDALAANSSAALRILFSELEPGGDTARATSTPNTADICFMGKVIRQKHYNLIHPTPGTTRRVTISDILYPLTPCTDHMSALFSRQFLLSHADLRYDTSLSILEDTIFVLRSLERATAIYSNPTIRVYEHRHEGPSLTAGAWNDDRSRRFTSDIILFFKFFKDYAASHSDPDNTACPNINNDSKCHTASPHRDERGDVGVQALYRRYRYVYLRCLAVKGIPWSLMKEFRNVVGPLDDPQSLKERLLFNPLFHHILTTLCRTLRKRT